MTEQHTIAVVARHLAEAARPLIESCRVEGAFKRLMARLGFSPTALPPAFQTAALDVEAALAKLASLPADPSAVDLAGVLGATRKIFDTIASLGNASAPPGVDAIAFKAEFRSGLIGLLVNDYLSRDYAAAFNLFATLGVIEERVTLPPPGRPSFVKLQFNWANIPRIVGQPAKLPEIVYKWGTQDFGIRKVLDDVAEFFVGLDFPVSIRARDPVDAFSIGNIAGSNFVDAPPVIEWRFYHEIVGDKPIYAGFALHGLPAAGGLLPGLMLEPRIAAELDLAVDLHPKVKLRLRPGTNKLGRIGLEVRPNHIGVRNLSAPATPPPSDGLGIGFDFNPGAPTVLLGDPKASRLEFSSASVDLNADFSNGAWSVLIAADLNGFKFVFDPGEGDGFLRFLIGGDKTEIGLPLGLRWGQDGIRFGGSASFEVVVHPHLVDRSRLDRRDRLPARRAGRSEATRPARDRRRHFRRHRPGVVHPERRRAAGRRRVRAGQRRSVRHQARLQAAERRRRVDRRRRLQGRRRS